MQRLMKAVAQLMLVVSLIVLSFSVVVLATEAGEAVVPFIDLLPQQVLVFGASGGAIVSILLSVLKYFGLVGKDGLIPTQTANFLLSVIVAAVAGVLSGQTFGTAILSAFAAMVAASGFHETVGHAVAKATGNR